MKFLNKLSNPPRTAGVVAALCAALVPSAFGKTFVLPHMLEKSGSISTTTFTFDTTVFITYNQSLSGADKGSAAVEFYLYDEQTGQLMVGAGGTPVCGPCVYQLGSQNRKVSIRLDDLIQSNGGGFDTAVKLGFGVIVVGGANPDAVNIQGFVVNSHTGPFDLSVFGFDPVPLESSAAAAPRTYSFPHVLETSGRVASDPFSFDTTIFATYTGGLPGTPPGTNATVQVYLYDQSTGQPMIGGGGVDVCNPCTFAMGTGAAGTAAPRKRTIVLDDMILNAGGFGGASVKQGFAIVTVGGSDPAGVALQGFVVNAHTGPFDISALVMEPEQVKTNPPPTPKRTWVIPHILEKSGLTSVENFTFDTTIFATYGAGIADIPPGAGASLDLYLYNDGGGLMLGSNGLAVCNPCTFALGTNNASGTPRKLSIRIDDLIMSQGGFDALVKLGYGVIVVGGADPNNVSLQGFVVNSHTGPFDLSVFGFQPQELGATARVPGTGSPGAPRRAFVIPHVLERSGTIASANFTFDTTLHMTYAGGLPGSVSSNGASAKLFLYENSGIPMTGATGQVCNPCMFDFTTSARKVSINVDDLIVTRGGGYGGALTKLGFGVIVVDGDMENVNLQGFVVNSHTSAFDLAVFGFEPQPLQASTLRPMTINIEPIPGNVLLSVPTVIGGHYSIESMEKLDQADKSLNDKFDGDGTVQTRSIRITNSQSFFRVNGY